MEESSFPLFTIDDTCHFVLRLTKRQARLSCAAAGRCDLTLSLPANS
jgi:hypothetical protein